MKKELRISNLTEFFKSVQNKPFNILAKLENLVFDDPFISQRFIVDEETFQLSGVKESENGLIIYYKFSK